MKNGIVNQLITMPFVEHIGLEPITFRLPV